MRKPILPGIGWVILVGALWAAPVYWMTAASAAPDAIDAHSVSTTFETLTIGGQTLRRATVFERTADMVYVKHDGGLLGVRVGELDRETRQLLGYEVVAEAEDRSNRKGRGDLGAQAGELAATMSDWPGLRSELEGSWGAGLGMMILGIAGLIGLLAHLLISYLLRMICQKAGSTPGPMIWMPFLQVFPLLKAAGMSRRWPFAIVILSILGTLLAGFSIELALLLSLGSSLLGLGLWIAWSIRICLARGKHPVWAVMLLLPGFNLVGLVYLAASE
jgi:hypothetical protein